MNKIKLFNCRIVPLNISVLGGKNEESNITLVTMNSIDENILPSAENYILVLMGQMGPARFNMAVVEPAMLPEPPHMVF